MQPSNQDTEYLWRALLTLLNLVLVLALVGLSYILLKPTIQDYLNRPEYTAKQLEEYSERRAKLRNLERSEDWNLVENGVHVKTGLKADENLQLIISSCTSCHSSKLIIQNKATREGWQQMIKWMQATQGLADLGADEPKILDYLARHYAPQAMGRRKNLDMQAIEWYVLDLQSEE